MSPLQALWWKCKRAFLFATGQYRHSAARISLEFLDARFAQHVKLYVCAGQIVRGKTVLDVGWSIILGVAVSSRKPIS